MEHHNVQASQLTPKREIYAEILRIVAAFTVVFQHTVTSVWYTVPVDSDDFAALNFLNSLSRFGVGVFIMISGAFMLSPKYPHPPRKILAHNIPRTLIPLVFWVLIYGTVGELLSGGDLSDVLSTPLLLFTKPASHLWFLYTIVGLYILTPPLRVFTQNASQKMVLYVIGIFFAFGLMLPTASHLLAKLAGFTLYKNIGIQGITSFAGFYLTGFYLAHFGIPQKARKILYGAALFSWIVAFAASTYFSELKNTPNEYFFGNFRPTTYLMATGVFCFFRNRFGSLAAADLQSPPKIKAANIALRVSGCMLGVYLIHPLFIKVFYGLKLTILEPHPIITAPVAAIGIFAVSLMTVYLLRQVCRIKKIL